MTDAESKISFPGARAARQQPEHKQAVSKLRNDELI